MPALIKHALIVLMLSLLFMLGACVAPTSSPSSSTAPPAPAQADSPRTSPQPAPAPAPPAATPDRPTRIPPMSDPLPPERGPAPAAKPVQVDRSCKADSDCVVKNVGNCCGYYPACVHKDSPTDPARVQAQCAEDGMASVCGFAEIQGCRCVQGQCIAGTAAIDPSQGPPAAGLLR